MLPKVPLPQLDRARVPRSDLLLRMARLSLSFRRLGQVEEVAEGLLRLSCCLTNRLAVVLCTS